MIDRTREEEGEVATQYLLSRPRGLRFYFSHKYAVSQRGSYCCSLHFDDWRGTEFSLQDIRFRIRNTGRGCWQLMRGGIEVARCENFVSGVKEEFGLRFAGREWRFTANREGLSRYHQILEGALEVGQVRSKIGWLSNGLEANFDREPALEIVCFGLWLIGIHWVGVAGKVTPVRAQMGI